MLMLIVVLFLEGMGFLVGFAVGLLTIDGYQTKKTCRTCRRRMVECGFHVDGKVYKCLEREGRNGGIFQRQDGEAFNV